MERTTEYRQGDFIQVKRYMWNGNEEISVWVNALYFADEGGYHVVAYSNGTKELLNPNTEIRKATKEDL